MTSEPSTAGSDSRRTTLRENAVAAVKKAAVATKWLVLGAGTAILALVGVIASALVAAFCLVGIGVFLLAPMLSAVRWIADLERRRLTAIGSPVPQPYSRNPTEWREAWQFLRSDPAPRRDIAWLCIHATFGLVVGLLPLELLSNAVEELTAPLWWHLAPPGGATMLGGLLPIDSSADARWAIVTGICWAILWFVLPPSLLRAQVAPGNRWLPPHPDVDLSARVTELTATRAAALDAHAVELRRIERALHDGAQNRLVTVAVLTGAARQALARDPAHRRPTPRAGPAERRTCPRRTTLGGAEHSAAGPGVRGIAGCVVGAGRAMPRGDPGGRTCLSPMPRGRRGGGLLHRGRGAHERHPPQRCSAGRCAGAAAGQHTRGRGDGRRLRGCGRRTRFRTRRDPRTRRGA